MQENPMPISSSGSKCWVMPDDHHRAAARHTEGAPLHEQGLEED
jgi:hypothetical protein